MKKWFNTKDLFSKYIFAVLFTCLTVAFFWLFSIGIKNYEEYAINKSENDFISKLDLFFKDCDTVGIKSPNFLDPSPVLVEARYNSLQSNLNNGDNNESPIIGQCDNIYVRKEKGTVIVYALIIDDIDENGNQNSDTSMVNQYVRKRFNILDEMEANTRCVIFCKTYSNLHSLVCSEIDGLYETLEYPPTNPDSETAASHRLYLLPTNCYSMLLNNEAISFSLTVISIIALILSAYFSYRVLLFFKYRIKRKQPSNTISYEKLNQLIKYSSKKHSSQKKKLIAIDLLDVLQKAQNDEAMRQLVYKKAQNELGIK